jgi:TolA-binding protein
MRDASAGQDARPLHNTVSEAFNQTAESLRAKVQSLQAINISRKADNASLQAKFESLQAEIESLQQRSLVAMQAGNDDHVDKRHCGKERRRDQQE